jgi:hypothetical protein
MDSIYSQFTDEATAFKEIEEAGYFPLTLDFAAESNENHWHDFDSLTYIIGGELTVTYPETEEVRVCSAGTKIIGNRGVLHREDTQGYKAIFGFSVDPRDFSQPINKPPPAII